MTNSIFSQVLLKWFFSLAGSSNLPTLLTELDQVPYPTGEKFDRGCGILGAPDQNTDSIRRVKYPITLIMIFYCFIGLSAYSDESQVDSTNWIREISTPQEALVRALVYTGFDATKGYLAPIVSESVHDTIIHDTTLSFMGNSLGPKRAWSVTFRNINIDSTSNDYKYPSEFEVLLDAQSGQLIKIISNFVGYDPSRSDAPPSELYAKEPDMAGFDCRSFPLTKPKNDFCQILRPGNEIHPMQAKQYIAVFILCSDRLASRDSDSTAQGYWNITLRVAESQPSMGSFPTKQGGTISYPLRSLVQLMTVSDSTCETVALSNISVRTDKDSTK